MGGVFNTVNANLYHYAGNNPVKYTDPDGKIAFCAVTALICAGVGAGLAAHKSYQDTGKIDGWKVLEGAVIGGAVGLGLGLVAAELATSTALSSGNALASFSTVTGISASSTVAGTTATSTAIAVVESPSSSKLAQNLINEGISRPAQTAAHHIVAGCAKAAGQARSILAKFGIGINDAVNGVFLPQNLSSANPNGATVHSTLHTKKYYDMVTMMLKTCSSKEDVISTLSQIRKLLENGEW